MRSTRGLIAKLSVWILVMYLVVQCGIFVYKLENRSVTGKFVEHVRSFVLLNRVWARPLFFRVHGYSQGYTAYRTI